MIVEYDGGRIWSSWGGFGVIDEGAVLKNRADGYYIRIINHSGSSSRWWTAKLLNDMGCI